MLTAPNIFDQDEGDGRVVLLITSTKPKDIAAVTQAARLCCRTAT
nr:hypothetical protein [Rhizohabitans arisaemae]